MTEPAVQRRHVLVGVLSLPAALLPLVPIAYLVVRAVGAGADAWRRTLEGELVEIALRSILMAIIVAVGAALIAVPYAFLVVRTNLRARRAWAVLGALPLVVPSYVGAIALVGLLGPRGELQGLLEPLGVDRLPEVDGFVGATVVLILFTYPYVMLLVAQSMRRVDTSLERAARGMGDGPWTSFRRATLPQLRPAIGAGMLLSALYALGDFGVVSVYRVDTFTRAIYLRYGALFDREGAAMLGLVLCVLTLVLLVGERRLLQGDGRAARRGVRAGDASSGDRVDLGRWRVPSYAFLVGVATASLIAPVGMLVGWLVRGGWTAARTTFVDDVAPALWGTVSAAGAGAVVTTVVALPVAVLVVRSGGRWARIVDASVHAGYALPGLVTALGLVFLSTRTLPALYQTFALMVVAYVIRFVPQSLGATRASLERIDPTLEDASRGLGRSGLQTLRHVTLPLAAPGVVTGTLLVFLAVARELPATLVLRPTGFETLATEIWNSTSVADQSAAAVSALVLIAVGAVPSWLLIIRPSVQDVTGSGDPSGRVAPVPVSSGG